MITVTNLEAVRRYYPDVRACVRNGVLVSFGPWRSECDDESLLPFTQEDILAMEAPAPKTELTSLELADNAFLEFCSGLGCAGKATTEEIEAVAGDLLETALSEGDLAGAFTATRYALVALSLMNEVTQHGGDWVSIPDVPHTLEETASD